MGGKARRKRGMTHSLLGEPLHPHDPFVQYRRKAQPGDIGYLAQGGEAVCFAEFQGHPHHQSQQKQQPDVRKGICPQVEEQDGPADGSQTKL